jgi:hypothetical protein
VKKFLLPVAIALFAAGCGRDINNKEAVRAGVVDYLSKRTQQTGLDMGLMNVDVTSVSFQKNEAHATIAFKPKGSESAAGGMTMNYVLERRGDKWVVKGRQESGLNPHGAAPGGALPGAVPPAESAPGAMPPNHPPVPNQK